MPAIRNAILMILAHKSAAELLERTGKEALAAEIMRESVRPMGIEIEPRASRRRRQRGKPAQSRRCTTRCAASTSPASSSSRARAQAA